MSVSVLARLLEAAGYELKAVKLGYARTLEDVLAEQRSGEADMILDVHVGTKTVATLYRERDEYVLRYLPEAVAADFVSLTMPVGDSRVIRIRCGSSLHHNCASFVISFGSHLAWRSDGRFIRQRC